MLILAIDMSRKSANEIIQGVTKVKASIIFDYMYCQFITKMLRYLFNPPSPEKNLKQR